MRQPQVIQMKSFTGHNWYTVRPADCTCTCLEFNATGNPCKHLNAVGTYRIPRPFVSKAHPTFSQALSAVVKSIRLRRLDDAIYWLVYLDTFKEPACRFRTARRILIGSAEDGHSIGVMEKELRSFRRMSRVDTSLAELVGEVMRICKVPNWWN